MALTPLDERKFRDPATTLDGSPRASVMLRNLETLWFNTGTLCNITCAHCYIESSPTNDRFVYLRTAEMQVFLDEIAAEKYPVRELGFTGGEPFMNPDMLAMLEVGLRAGYECLVLTNAMRPMQRPQILKGLLALRARYGERLRLRVSLDHYTKAAHESERGARTWDSTLQGCDWLAHNGFVFSVAGRMRWDDTEASAREGFAKLFRAQNWSLTTSAEDLVLFPEMETESDVPEITDRCWTQLGVSPTSPMCASARMVVKRKGALVPAVLACTLLPYDDRFELGETLKASAQSVALNHPHCARFCVLGGGNCSG